MSNGFEAPSKEELSNPELVILLAEAISVVPIPTGDPDADRYFVNGSVTTFEVERSWNFGAPKLLKVTSGFPGGGCGFTFKANERYLVFAQRGKDGELTTSTCSRTTLTKDVPELLPILIKLRGPGNIPRKTSRKTAG